jgi:hypothetical protein
MPAKTTETPSLGPILHDIHKNPDFTGTHVLSFKDAASKSAFLERLDRTKVTVTHDWDNGFGGENLKGFHE